MVRDDTPTLLPNAAMFPAETLCNVDPPVMLMLLAGATTSLTAMLNDVDEPVVVELAVAVVRTELDTIERDKLLLVPPK